MKWGKLALVYLFPPLFHFAYQPVNQEWTVKRFGCGCPLLDLSWRFNANHFNMILWLSIYCFCIGAMIHMVQNGFESRLQMRIPCITDAKPHRIALRSVELSRTHLIAGLIFVLAGFCVECWAKELWF